MSGRCWWHSETWHDTLVENEHSAVTVETRVDPLATAKCVTRRNQRRSNDRRHGVLLRLSAENGVREQRQAATTAELQGDLAGTLVSNSTLNRSVGPSSSIFQRDEGAW
jgi:hypothetical protein